MFKSKKFYIILLLLLLALWYFKFAKHYPHNITLEAKADFWGVTYSPKFATALGLDWQEVYLAILDDLEVKYIRLPFYWDQIETTEGEFDFSDYDYLLAEGKKRNVKFIANIGWRLPRWPECHNPTWLDTTDLEKIKEKNLVMMKKIIERYQNRTEIIYWQVENEPLLDWFGQCPAGDLEYLKQEIAFVKNLDDREIIVSASGELSTWRQEAQLADIFGTTMYRVVWNPVFGYFRYPLPTWFYTLKARQQNLIKSEVIISELQTEPWVPNGTLADLDFQEFDKSFNLAQFKANLQYAINVDFKQTYLWGVEWWYLQKTLGNTEYWDLGRTIIR